MGLDCGGMFLGKHVLSFTKPKPLGKKNSLRQLTIKNSEIHPRGIQCWVWFVESFETLWYAANVVPSLTTYSPSSLSQPAAWAQTEKGQATWVQVYELINLCVHSSIPQRFLALLISVGTLLCSRDPKRKRLLCLPLRSLCLIEKSFVW